MKNTPSRFFGLLFLAFLAISYESSGQQDSDSSSYFKYRYTNKKFIDKIELFAGPGLSFNYGNKFIENYNDENASNKRLLKPGYLFGLGIYHSVSERLTINARVQYEVKGRKTELNTPLTSSSRVISIDDYTYKYFTIAISTQIFFGRKRKAFVTIGPYLSKIKGLSSIGCTYNTLDQHRTVGYLKGRYFYNLRKDGTIDSFTWVEGLSSFENIDLGTAFSVGCFLRIAKKQSLAIQIIENLGLRNINKNNPYRLDEKNHSINVILGYIINR